MDVTRDNFEASLDALADAIADPHFAFWSFDLEFTGLNASSATTFDLLDTPSDRFSKVHESCRHMTVLQYGVCCFAFNPSTRRWTARPFNFWLFPDAGRGTDAVFSCQASSMAFLADCGFDFNKAIRRGVPFVPAAERERNAERRARAANRPPIVPTNERDKEMVRRLREDVAAWLARGEPPTPKRRRLVGRARKPRGPLGRTRTPRRRYRPSHHARRSRAGAHEQFFARVDVPDAGARDVRRGESAGVPRVDATRFSRRRGSGGASSRVRGGDSRGRGGAGGESGVRGTNS